MKLKPPESIRKSPELYVPTVLIFPQYWAIMLLAPDNTELVFFAEECPDQTHDVFSSFKDCFFENDFFSLPFRKVFVVNYSSDFTFIPNSIDVKHHGKKILQYLSSEKGGVVLHHPVEGMGLNVLHRLPEAVYDFFSRSFEAPQFIHHLAPQIRYLATKSRDAANKQMFINRQQHEMDIICFHKGKLLLANTCHVRNLQDALYFILFTWKQLKFDRSKDSVTLAGETAENNITAKELQRYIQNVELHNIQDFPSINPYLALTSKEYIMSFQTVQSS
ncbi:MAG: DUF3822 family protein [Dysgonamonadaceae bacterium]|jgi:hypothetical protein|nr:DUF3822 family protein [Dysgonamonadaceae bacterium]